MERTISGVGFILLALGPATALQLSAVPLRFNTVPLQFRTQVAMEAEASAKQCALISLSAEDPLRLAQVLKKAWMEGGVKRGLVGSVLVGEDTVQIAAQGETARLQSFADWVESSSMLVTGVELMGLDQCPAETLTTKFPLADVEAWSGATPGSFTGDLAEQLKSLSVGLDAKRGVTQSNDEGLF
eukprot:CAMPEP_0183350676 /NCGR_PEP_ID=MMETSP0164_2-20130417/20716_1 /TAXON_ID=221442 /ORGANISM="Coccolithus pelagicus ssp braarudi, Strain PLY182g" /LENGTH=184 /DNA_ID=CAMNT_0025522653 /DNA_START=105 /DNA_END=659 /DNA_ORIENTATION=-